MLKEKTMLCDAELQDVVGGTTTYSYKEVKDKLGIEITGEDAQYCIGQKAYVVTNGFLDDNFYFGTITNVDPIGIGALKNYVITLTVDGDELEFYDYHGIYLCSNFTGVSGGW